MTPQQPPQVGNGANSARITTGSWKMRVKPSQLFTSSEYLEEVLYFEVRNPVFRNRSPVISRLEKPGF